MSQILGEGASFSKILLLRQSALMWPKMIVTGAWDVYDKLSTEEGELPQQKDADIEDGHHSGMAGELRRSFTLDRRRKYDYERFDEKSQGIQAALGSGTPERRREFTTRRHVGLRKIRVSVKTYTDDKFNAYYQ